jgi:hypothetical protein
MVPNGNAILKHLLLLAKILFYQRDHKKKHVQGGEKSGVHHISFLLIILWL